MHRNTILSYSKSLLPYLIFLNLPVALGQTKTARIDQPISSPTYVNLYWDNMWDADNSTMKVARVDALTQVIIQSSYFAGLSEYGVGNSCCSPSFAGGFLPDPSCASEPPAMVGFYDPNPLANTIAGFIQCEHDRGPAVLRQSNVIYNVILPPFAIESDFWSANFCNGDDTPVSWHYHGLQGTLPPLSGQPIFTIVLTHNNCGGNNALFNHLTHEMVEAATDPFPIDISIIPPHISISSFSDEIADKQFCGGATTEVFADVSGVTPLASPVTVAQYWSNDQQRCVAFTDNTVPTISNVVISSWGSQTTFSVTGSGFGRMPGQIGLPSSALPYVELTGTTQNWEAGNTINGDAALVHISDWSDTQLNSLALRVPPRMTVNNAPGAALLAWVCNPNSLNCISHQATATAGPYNPRLAIINTVSGQFSSGDSISISMLLGTGTQPVMTNTVLGFCAPCTFGSLQTLSPAAYSFTQTVSGAVPINTVSNGCHVVTLVFGQETSCLISDQAAPIPSCPSGDKYCGLGVNGRPICVPKNAQCP